MFDEVLELLKDTLKGAFTRDNEKERKRKIIFWYDSKEEYLDFVNELDLEDTEVIKYDNNSFWIRYHIEKEELNKNIIIYLPFDRKKGIDNDLLDLETSNSDLLFNPDSTTMRLKNLGLTEDCRNVINKYAKFFANKKREKEFKNFDIEDKNNDVTRVKFHKETVSPTSLLEFIEKTGDGSPITKQIKVGNGSNEDYIEVAISSYNVVKELCQIRKK